MRNELPSIRNVLELDEKQAIHNVQDFLDSIHAMGYVLVDENDTVDNAEIPSDDFVIEQYFSTFSGE